MNALIGPGLKTGRLQSLLFNLTAVGAVYPYCADAAFLTLPKLLEVVCQPAGNVGALYQPTCTPAFRLFRLGGDCAHWSRTTTHNTGTRSMVASCGMSTTALDDANSATPDAAASQRSGAASTSIPHGDQQAPGQAGHLQRQLPREGPQAAQSGDWDEQQQEQTEVGLHNYVTYVITTKLYPPAISELEACRRQDERREVVAAFVYKLRLLLSTYAPHVTHVTLSAAMHRLGLLLQAAALQPRVKANVDGLEDLLVEALRALRDRVEAADAQSFCNVLWGSALACTAGTPSGVERPEPAQLHKLLSGTVHALRSVMKSAAAVLPARLDDTSPQNVANMVWALARLRYAPDAAVEAALQRHLLAHVSEYDARHLSMMVWGFGQLQVTADADALHAAGARLRALAAEGAAAPQAVVNFLFGLAMLGRAGALELGWVLRWAAPRVDLLQDPQLQQLYLVHELVHGPAGGAQGGAPAEGGGADGGGGALLDALLERCEEAWLARRLGNPLNSFSMRVATALQMAAVEVDSLQPVGTHFATLVAHAPPDGVDVVVEPLSDNNLTTSRPYRILGRALLRLQLLRAHGVPVAVVPWHEWAGTHGTKYRTNYLLNKVHAAVELTAEERAAEAADQL